MLDAVVVGTALVLTLMPICADEANKPERRTEAITAVSKVARISFLGFIDSPSRKGGEPRFKIYSRVLQVPPIQKLSAKQRSRVEKNLGFGEYKVTVATGG